MRNIFHKLERYFVTWSLGVLNEKKGLWPKPATAEYLGYARAMNAQGYHILMRPSDSREVFYLVCDDLSQADLERDHRLDGKWRNGRLVVETSPANYQVWIHFSHHLSLSEKTFWLKRLRSDPGCSPRHRWGRCPGFRNRKTCHERGGHYPLARLIWVDWNSQATIEKKHRSTRTDAPQPRSILSPSPPVGLCAKKISRGDYERGNDSATDFAYVLALMVRGVPEHEVLTRLLQERQSWTHHGQGDRRRKYLQRTLQKAQQRIGG